MVNYQNISTDNKDEEFPTRKLPNKEPRSNNRLDPSDKKGRCSNVFKIEINYPPNEKEMAEIKGRGVEVESRWNQISDSRNKEIKADVMVNRYVQKR